VFKTIPVANVTYREDMLPAEAQGFARDAISLAWEARLKTRGRRRSDQGLEFGTSLPRGTILRAGDCFVIEPARTIVEVVEQREPAFVIEPRSPSEWGLFAYHIGNGHQPLMVTDRVLVCPDLPGVEMLLQYHRIPYTRADVAFTPATAVLDHRFPSTPE
jgi:urease accessory protein UreE